MKQKPVNVADIFRPKSSQCPPFGNRRPGEDVSGVGWALGPASEDVQFYLPEQTVPEDAHMVLLAGGHPKKSSTIWRHGSDGRTHLRILRS